MSKIRSWFTFVAMVSFWKFPHMSDGENKEANDAKLRALQMKGKGKRKHRNYKKPETMIK